MLNDSRFDKLITWAASGTLFIVAFAHPFFWWLSIPALALFLRAVAEASQLRFVLIGSSLVGLAKMISAIGWSWDLYPLTWLPFDSAILQMALIGVYWVVSALGPGLGLLVAGVGSYYVARTCAKKWLLLVFPILVVLSEIAGSLLFSLILMGPGSYPNVYFGFGYVGNLFAHNTSVLSLATFGGVYALSFFVAFCATLVYFVVYERSVLRTVVPYAGVAVVLCVLVYANIIVANQTDKPHDTEVIAIDTFFTAKTLTSLKGTKLQQREIQDAVLTALQYEPDILVLPESGAFIKSFDSPSQALAFLDSYATKSVTVIDSHRTPLPDGGVALRGYIFDTEQSNVYRVDKQFLVPQGEYISYLTSTIFKLIGKRELLEQIAATQDFRPGPRASYADIPDDVPSVLFCFENVSPVGVFNVVANRPNTNLVVNTVSHSWFHEPKLLWRQVDAMLRIQAAWNDVAVIPVGNMASTGTIFRPNGDVENGEALTESEYWRLTRYMQ